MKKKLSHVVPKAMVHTEADAVAEEVAKTIKYTLTYVKPEAPVEKVVETVRNVESKALVIKMH